MDQRTSPYQLDQKAAYLKWRQTKLDNLPESVEQLIVNMDDLNQPGNESICSIKEKLNNHNMAVFSLSETTKVVNDSLLKFADIFSLSEINKNEGAEESGVTRLSVSENNNWRGTYIPYTNKAINWHTDGYYNSTNKQIRGFILYCEQHAFEGGENKLLDPEMAYIHLRDINPEYIEALSQDDVMMIPANDVSSDSISRPDRYGPVFSVDQNGNLHTRYTARKRNIVWKDTPIVQQAVKEIENLLASNSNWIMNVRLNAGQGLICNNVLHTRSSFTDSKQLTRVYHRLRYYDRTD